MLQGVLGRLLKDGAMVTAVPIGKEVSDIGNNGSNDKHGRRHSHYRLLGP